MSETKGVHAPSDLDNPAVHAFRGFTISLDLRPVNSIGAVIVYSRQGIVPKVLSLFFRDASSSCIRDLFATGLIQEHRNVWRWKISNDSHLVEVRGRDAHLFRRSQLVQSTSLNGRRVLARVMTKVDDLVSGIRRMRNVGVELDRLVRVIDDASRYPFFRPSRP